MEKVVRANSTAKGCELMLNMGVLKRKLFLDFLQKRHPEQYREIVDSKTHDEFLFNFAKALEASLEEFESVQG